VRCWAIAPMVLAARAVARLPQRVVLALGGSLEVVRWPLAGSPRRIPRNDIALCVPDPRNPRTMLS